MVAQQANRTVTIYDRALAQLLVGKLKYIALRGTQYVKPLGKQFVRRQRRMPAALQTDELGDIFEILAKNIVCAFCEHGHGAYTEAEEPLPSGGIVDHVDGDKCNFFARKKLFRS